MYFIYNGVDSRDLGIRVKDIPYDVLANRRMGELVLDRYNGTIYTDKGTYDSYYISLECMLVDNFEVSHIRKIKELFITGKGELTLSYKPNLVYKVVVSNSLTFTEMIKYTGSFILTFKVEPMAILSSGLNYVPVTNNMKLVNEGNFESCPRIKVGSPTSFVKIYINGKLMEFANVVKPFIIDVELEDVIGLDGENLNNYMKLSSDFVKLSTGENTILVEGATGVSIQPRWVEL